MKHVLVVAALACFVLAHPVPEEDDYASYANMYPEIAKKIGEEPIEIIDVVKAVLVYDSDDATPQNPSTAEPDSESVNGTTVENLDDTDIRNAGRS